MKSNGTSGDGTFVTSNVFGKTSILTSIAKVGTGACFPQIVASTTAQIRRYRNDNVTSKQDDYLVVYFPERANTLA